MIEPRVLKGFRDSLPEYEIFKQQIIGSLTESFESFGFVPIDTPVLEYRDVLLGKGGGETDKQVYTFSDHGSRDVAMRFDLTVPFARFMAAHVNELPLPFKRYHINKVWRGENTQKGRYREFYQCDFDIVGIDHVSADFEILFMMYSALKYIGIPAFTIRIAHRGILNTFLDQLGAGGASAEILRIVDKLQKIGETEVLVQLQEYLTSRQAEQILSFINAEGSNKSILDTLSSLCGGKTEDIIRLETLLQYADEAGFSDSVEIDPSITRGLDYYTGTVFETFLNDLPNIGSICSGGRYNELASLYTKEHLPGVGSSIGLDRLLAALDELGLYSRRASTVDILIFCMDDSHMGYYQKTASQLREAGLHAEVYLTKRKMQQQFSYAEKRMIPLGLMIGDTEYQAGTYTIRDLRTRMQHEVSSMHELIQTSSSLLEGEHD